MTAYVGYVVGALGLAFGANCYWIAHRWARDCKACHIIIARKGRVALNAPLTEWLAWNRALPYRDRGKGGIIFHANGIQVALARPKFGPDASTQKTTQGEKPNTVEGVPGPKRSTTIPAGVE